MCWFNCLLGCLGVGIGGILLVAVCLFWLRRLSLVYRLSFVIALPVYCRLFTTVWAWCLYCELFSLVCFGFGLYKAGLKLSFWEFSCLGVSDFGFGFCF